MKGLVERIKVGLGVGVDLKIGWKDPGGVRSES